MQLGRPCSIQPTEIDLYIESRFSSLSVDGQFLGRMRQFTRLTWDAYGQAYSLGFKGRSMAEHSQALEASESALSLWHESWLRESSWSQDAPGLILESCKDGQCFCPRGSHLWLTDSDYTNLRILTHRPFLAVLGRKQDDMHSQDFTVIRNASKCVELSMSAIKAISAIDYGSHGVLGAAIFQFLYQLWNATVSLLLYRAVQHKLSATTLDLAVVDRHVDLAIDCFSAYAGSVHSARLAHQDITRVHRQLYTDREQPIPDFDVDAHMLFDMNELLADDASTDYWNLDPQLPWPGQFS